MTKSVALELSPSWLCLPSLALASMLCDPISAADVLQVQTGLVCPFCPCLAVHYEHVLQWIVLGSDAASVKDIAARPTGAGWRGGQALQNWRLIRRSLSHRLFGAAGA